MQQIANSKIETALKLVQSTTANETSTRPKLLKLQQLMKDGSTIKNTPCAKWPRLPDRPGEQKTTRVRFAMNKKSEYLSIRENCLTNQSQIFDQRKLIEIQQVSSKKVGNSAAIASVVNATIAVEKKFDEYVSVLNKAITEVDQILDEIKYERSNVSSLKVSLSVPLGSCGKCYKK